MAALRERLGDRAVLRDRRTFALVASERYPEGRADPAGASLLYRRMAEGILARGSSRLYGYAARDVAHSASLAGRVADDGGIEGHGAFWRGWSRSTAGRIAVSGSCSRRNDAKKSIRRLIFSRQLSG